MTARRPPGTNCETWVEKQIRESMERGEFDELEGAGRPIADLDEPNDELRWVRQKLRREGFAFLPPSLALRRDALEAREQARHARTAQEARRILDEVNVRLVAAVRIPLAGPEVYVPPFDVDKAVAQWHADHPATDEPAAERATAEPPPRRRLLPRRRR
ncbi:DUF1992 domain-containing protein [Aquihabitans sp. G128]|uniref:DnaJ family domain-containing protein n=1 Tax=Aquihabitans sp. G128 TaxID=2849779 RepID=UPI001C21E803|nr:DUF1992 domain-containing protein [Aquihabitans sp. G128]QXC63100.1 DUF1992 domain-containing protein [Aquihabitans sp. G128]